MKPRLAAFSSPSFALISVLALVSLAALTATAFLASARLERQATRSLGETARLEMACASARACANQTLNVMCQKSWQILPTYWRGTNATDWTNELGYLLIGYPNAANVQWAFTCGFNPAIHKKLDTTVFKIEGTNTNPGSYLSEIGSFMATMTNGFVTNPTSTDTNCTLIPLLGGRTSPPVGWTYIYQDKKIANSTNTTNVPVARFSYYMEDLSGLIDAERMGGTNRTTGTNASEISLTNLTTNWSSNSIINASNYNQFIDPTNRAKYFSPGMMLYAGGLSTNDLRYFAHGLLSWDSFPNTIPMGIAIANGKGYANANTTTRKVNLNTSANLNVTAIAGAINANLPGFTNRAGGMNGAAYANNISANIVDYVDTDGSPTIVGTYSTPNYSQGVDSYPWVNEVATRVTVQSYNASSSQLVLNVRGFAELWNLSDKSFTGPITLTMNEDDSIQAQSATAITAANTPLRTSGTLTTNITILPMEFKVVEVFSNLVTLNVPEPAGTGTKYVTWPTASTNSTFELKIGAATVQKPLGGLARRVDTTLSLGSNIDSLDLTTPALMETGANSRKIYRGNPLTHTTNASFDFMNEGDPRMTPFRIIGTTTSHTWATYETGASYFMGNGRSSFGGWNTNSSLSQLSLTNLLEPSRPLTPGNMPTGPVNANGIFAVLPTSVVPISPEPTKALQKLNNTGTFSNIFELGNIFDPVQWSFSSGVKPGGSIPASAVDTGTAKRRGGGNTLRIGRPEHPRFAFTNLGGTYPVPNMGQSAAALLDIFSVSDSYDNGGRINLNTAPAPVLRALAGGVILTNDSGMKPSSTLPIPEIMTEAFAQGVMRFRAVNPFLTCSQLAFITTDYGITNPTTSHWTNTWPTNAVFGNTNASIPLTNAPGNTLGTTASMGVSEWNDQASEEWFSKIYNLSTVQSWNYRTYVVAQLVNTNGLPTGPSMRKYSLIYVRYGGVFPAISAGPYVSFESPY